MSLGEPTGTSKGSAHPLDPQGVEEMRCPLGGCLRGQGGKDWGSHECSA